MPASARESLVSVLTAAPARQKAEQVERHDPGQILVEQGTVVGPPAGLHRAVGPEQQGKVKAEYHDGRVQQHQDHPAQQHLRHKLLCFLHKNPLLHRGGICPHPFFPALPAAGAKAPCACSAIISIVLYSILPPVSRTIPILRAFLPLPAGFFCPQDGPHLFAQPQRPLHGKADCRENAFLRRVWVLSENMDCTAAFKAAAHAFFTE